MLKNNNQKLPGFTLVELLTVVALSTIILLGAYSIYQISSQTYRKNSASAELTQNARIALERISRDLRQAMEMLTALPADPQTGTPTSEIKFQDGHIYFETGQIQYITFYLSGADLHRKTSHYAFLINPNQWVRSSAVDALGNPPTEYTDDDQIKAQEISSLEFWGTNPITTKLEVANDSDNYSFETKTYERNVL